MTHDEALDLILQHASRRSMATAGNLGTGIGTVAALSTALTATMDHPRFDSSSIDGYAIARVAANPKEPLRVASTVYAGDSAPEPIGDRETIRVMTGAPIPPNTFAVVMQEDVQVAQDGASITIRDWPTAWENCRSKGSEFAAGEILAAKGTPVSPGLLALAASQGFDNLPVIRPPGVLVVTTGDELVDPGAIPEDGQIRDSNAILLRASVSPWAQVSHRRVGDRKSELKKALTGTGSHGVVVVSGGASVGEKDYLADVVNENGVIYFHRLQIRPGKPVLFGSVNGRFVLGLPGNPASSFVCFHLFGIPLLKALSAWDDPRHTWFQAVLDDEHQAEDREVFGRVVVKDGVARMHKMQASYGLRSMVGANALARFPAGAAIRRGQTVLCTPLNK